MRHFIKLSVEAQAVAAAMKQQGLPVNVGDPLPATLPATLAQEIRAKHGWFRLAWYLAQTKESCNGFAARS